MLNTDISPSPSPSSLSCELLNTGASPCPSLSSSASLSSDDAFSLPLVPPVLVPGPSSSGVTRKRRRGISPEQRVQRPRVLLEESLDALHALTVEHQQMVETEASRGINGSQAIHR